MNYCPKCSTKLDYDDLFCPICGTRREDLELSNTCQQDLNSKINTNHESSTDVDMNSLIDPEEVDQEEVDDDSEMQLLLDDNKSIQEYKKKTNLFKMVLIINYGLLAFLVIISVEILIDNDMMASAFLIIIVCYFFVLISYVQNYNNSARNLLLVILFGTVFISVLYLISDYAIFLIAVELFEIYVLGLDPSTKKLFKKKLNEKEKRIALN